MRLIRKLLQNLKSRKIKLVNESNWTCVSESTDSYTIHIQKLQLEDEKIPAAIFDQRDSSYNAFGLIYLYVPKEFEEQALKVLNLEHEKPDH